MGGGIFSFLETGHLSMGSHGSALTPAERKWSKVPTPSPARCDVTVFHLSHFDECAAMALSGVSLHVLVANSTLHLTFSVQ
jgi:hypothetical protein